jgi:hypothetical protein
MLASKRQERGNKACALRLLSEITTRRDPPENDGAESYYRRAFAQATNLGMRPLVAYCHLGVLSQNVQPVTAVLQPVKVRSRCPPPGAV